MKLQQTLAKIKGFEFISKSLPNSKMNWDLKGFGTSCITLKKDHVFINNRLFIKENNLHLEDKILWKFNKNSLLFYRFQHGEYKLIFNFINKNNEFVLKAPYICKNDKYKAYIKFCKKLFIMEFFITGLTKNEHITYKYYLTN